MTATPQASRADGAGREGPAPGLEDARILIVDDDEAVLGLLEEILVSSGYTHIRTLTDPTEIWEILDEFAPDLVLLDNLMPQMNGVEVARRLASFDDAVGYLPVLMLTSDTSRETRRKALAGGAKDFLTKPFSPVEVRLRVENLLETRFLYRALRRQNESLEERVRERTAALEEARVEILERLALAAEYRDDETGQHTRRVGVTSARIGELLGLPALHLKELNHAAPLHDIGKIGIPDEILLKDGPLTASQWEHMKRHTVIGARILSESRAPVLRMAEEIAHSHHENWDGSGYPDELSGEEIPLPARIVAVADVFDSLTHVRPYKSAWPVDRAEEEIKRQRGVKFDPAVVDAFFELRSEVSGAAEADSGTADGDSGTGGVGPGMAAGDAEAAGGAAGAPAATSGNGGRESLAGEGETTE